MGYYIQTGDLTHGKAAYIIEHFGATKIPNTNEIVPPTWDSVPESLAIICVVDNGLFEAAAYAYDPRELAVFARFDGRPKTWLVLDRTKARQLAGYKGT